MGWSERTTSLGTKLALATVVVLSVVSLFLYQQLTSRERDHLLSSKTRAATMVTDLFAASLAAPLDFADADAVEVELGNLRINSEITDASVWSSSSNLLASLYREDAANVGGPPGAEGARVLEDRLIVTRSVLGRHGKPLGKAVVEFSLAGENAAFAANRTRILWVTFAMDAITALILILIARLQIINPLAKVAEGTHRLEKGQLDSRVDIKSRDEIGQLARAFNAMGAAIADREQRLEAARKSLRDLFDHMRQAIFAFGHDGRIVGEASRQATHLFGHEQLEGMQVGSLLYPEATEFDIEAQAFSEWIRAAFAVREDEWSDLASLAPSEVLIRRGDREPILLVLEFRPVAKRGKINRIMLLATDVSEQRNLELQAQSRELDHARQMAAMRRLLAGGPQVFVTFVEGARQRIARCLEIIGSSVRNLTSSEIDELFRHVHTIKGEAKALDMRDLEAESAKLEEELDELRARARGEGFATTGSVHSGLLANFARATDALDRGCEVFVAASPTGEAALDQVTVQRSDVLELLSVVGDRNDALGQVTARLASRPLGESTANLLDLVPTWADREGKVARLQVEGREVRVQPSLARVLGAVLTHLIRNAIVHGIEPPDARTAAGKPAGGVIRVAGEESKLGTIVTVEDDGRGLDTAQIAERAAALGQEVVRGLPPQELAFLPGLSTAGRPGELAGRGVGLYAVRAELASVGYVVEVFSRPGEHTKFVLKPSGTPGEHEVQMKDAHA
jgi:HAMP domain-containing protein/HPt (histidine-containing phosphotransfer) domain-containing protein